MGTSGGVAYYICDNVRDFGKMMGGRWDFRGGRDDFRGGRGDLKYNIEWNESFELIVNRPLIISEGGNWNFRGGRWDFRSGRRKNKNRK